MKGYVFYSAFNRAEIGTIFHVYTKYPAAMRNVGNILRSYGASSKLLPGRTDVLVVKRPRLALKVTHADGVKMSILISGFDIV